MSSNLKVNTILPSTGTNVAIGTAGGTVTMVGNVDIDINSGISTFNDIHISDKIVHDGDTNTSIRFPSSDTITFETNGSERLRIDSSGRVLIGTTSSAYKFCVADNTNASLVSQLVNTNTGSSTKSIFQIQTGSNRYVNFENDYTGQYIHVVGSGITTYFSSFDTHSFRNNAGTERLSIDSNGYLIAKGDIRLRRTASDNGAVYFGDTNNNYIFGSDADDLITFATANTERLRINSAGEVYIGSAAGNGQGKLFVNDSSGATTTQAHIRNAVSTGTAKVFLNLDDAKYASVGLENGSLVFRNSASSTPTERLRIDSSGVSTFSNDIRVDRGSTIDGLVGQAYSGYFGLKHADQSYGSEYMMISNDSHTYISCSSGSSIYLRPSANSSSHETVFSHDNSTFKTNIVMDGHPLRRLQHHWGHLEGGQNIIGATDAKSSPIYTIGSSYNPSDAALGNMYGIGYSHGNASFTPSGAGWGMYVASDGNSRIYLDGSNGRIYYDTSGRYLSDPTGDYSSVQVNGSGKNGWEGFSIDGRINFMHDGANSCGIYNDVDNEWFIQSVRNSHTYLYYNGSESMRTTGEGILVTRDIRWSGTGAWTGEATNGKIQIYGGHMYIQNGGTTTVWVFRNNAGTEKAQVLANGNYNPLSDVSVKKDITTVNGALNTVKQLTGRTFTFKDDDSKSSGVIAQELEPIIPDLVNSLPSTDINGGVALKTVNYTGLSAYFIEAIKELSAKVETLEQENIALRERVTNLEGE